MAREIGQRLQSLKSSRSGADRTANVAFDQLDKAYAAAASTELYEKRAPGKKFTEYALGAMQEVNPEYMAISLETAKRVGSKLEKGLAGKGYCVEFRLQVSVPANIHIRGYSDVDLVVLRTDFMMNQTAGGRAQRGEYTSPSSKATAGVLAELRGDSARILKEKFPAAEVDTSGGKALKISGGSLARDVDVVPSHWYDTVDYQWTNNEVDRGGIIYDRKAATVRENYPFKHIDLLRERDALARTGLKKASGFARMSSATPRARLRCRASTWRRSCIMRTWARWRWARCPSLASSRRRNVSSIIFTTTLP